MNVTVAAVTAGVGYATVVRVRTAMAAAAGARRAAKLHTDDRGVCVHCSALAQRAVPWPCLTTFALRGEGGDRG